MVEYVHFDGPMLPELYNSVLVILSIVLKTNSPK